MRKFITILFVLMLTASLSAQVRTGNIYGKVVDEEGNVLPGVTVTLTGSVTASMTTVTSAGGVFRFISLAAAQDYVIKAELEGFQTSIEEGLIVNVGANVDLTVTMKMGALEEEVTVVAVTPVVDTKRTTVSQNVTRDVLQSLPTARDPWVILQQAPGVMIDRENVGGSESGQQSTTMAKGGGQDQWSMDGVTITDFSSESSPGYYDFDAFEEINITLGGADVTVQGAGIQMNLVSRRGGNKTNIGGRFFFTDGDKFQADNLTDALAAEGVVGTNRIRIIKDFGFNVGGPLLKDKAWWWLSYGVQDITNSNLIGKFEATMLNNYAAKLNLQIIPENRFEAFVHVGGKEKTARSSSASFPGGWHQTGAFHFGSPIVKFQDEHMFGDNFFISVKFAYSNSGFNMIPEEDLAQQHFVKRNIADGVWENGYNAYRTIRPLDQYTFLANYFSDDLLGASHEFKVGFEYSDRGTGSLWGMPGNVLARYNYHTKQVDFDGDNLPDVNGDLMRVEAWRAYPMTPAYYQTKGTTAFLSDTITFGRFNLTVGLRWDKQVPTLGAFTIDALQKDNPAVTGNFSPAAITAIDALLPGLESPEVISNYSWNYITPRLGLTYDVSGNGKTIVKASFGQFRQYMGTWWADYFAPGGTGGWMDWWWFDAGSLGGNGNGMVDLKLMWTYPGVYGASRVFNDAGQFIGDADANDGNMYGGYDISDPLATSHSRYYVEDDAPSQRTTEMIVSVERELFPDFGVAVDFSYRKLDQFPYEYQYTPEDGTRLTNADYSQLGTVPSSIPGLDMGEGAGKPLYYWNADVPYRYERNLRERTDYYRDFMGFELRFTKRLSNRWMMNGSFTLQSNKVHYGSAGYVNPTNIWALDGNVYAPEIGGSSGKVSTPLSQNWMFKLSGLYQLPLDFNVSFTFNARQGNPLFHSIDIVDYDAPNSRSYDNYVYLDPIDTFRLPNFWNLNLRMEKVVRAGDAGRIYFMADLFNVFNQATILRRFERWHGTYYVDDQSFSPDARDNEANEILNPRVLRFGVRFQF